MNSEIIISKDSRYEEFEKLLFKRDALKREAEQYGLAYIQEFGDSVIEVFKMKIECIEKKKKIAYCQKMVNKGLEIKEDELNNYIEVVMKEYQDELDELIEENRLLKLAGSLKPIEIKKVKELYYRLAKLIHPDMRPDLADDEIIQEFWKRIVIAYNHNQLEELEILEFQVNDYLNNLDSKERVITIDNIEEKIIKVKKEIDEILANNPYQYKFILEDRKEREIYKRELNEELENYKDYSIQLDEILNGFEIVRTYS